MSQNKQKNSLFPCVCGHEFADHLSEDDISYKNVNRRCCQVQVSCTGLGGMIEYIDGCMDYRPDNLKYLEGLVNAKP